MKVWFVNSIRHSGNPRRQLWTLRGNPLAYAECFAWE